VGTASELVIRGSRIVTPEGVRPAAVHLAGGIVRAITAPEAVPTDVPVRELGDAYLLPGLVDTHVHVNEPGRTEWEGFESATRAAAAGGVTTLVDMPLNAVPATTSVRALEAKLAAARDRCTVDVGFWGGLVPGNAGELRPLHEAGVLGFKCFLASSGVDEFPHVDETDLRAALPVLAALGAPLLVHAELASTLAAVPAAAGDDPRSYASYLRSRPATAERDAISLLLRLCREHGARVHVVHLSDAGAIEEIRAARADGVAVTVETCPHYLHFAAEEIGDGATLLKCAPPIRGLENRERLWEGLAAGDIDLIVSDHSPCPVEMKGVATGDLTAAWGGIASLELGLRVVWAGSTRRGHAPERLAEWMSAAPARLAGLEGRKGAIAPGRDADLVVWEAAADAVIEPAALQHRNPLTPYAGASFPGRVVTTYLRGSPVYDEGRFPTPPRGQLLLRTG
jgi:allantoinase